jgi:chitin disaccharide deacetylase
LDAHVCQKATRLTRTATIVADDYGIGPETSRGILELACEGRLTATVVIVNAPDAERAVRAWRAADPPADLGWHPNLTLDRPVLPALTVPSLVRPDGTFWPLRQFLRRVCLGRVRHSDVRAEWAAQYRRFVELAGQPPALVNSHQHVSLFGPCGRALSAVLQDAGVRPYLRRVVEPARTLFRVPGARAKRLVLMCLSRRATRRQFPACDWLVGVTAPEFTADAAFWVRWLRHLPRSGSVELCCHPGYHDLTLTGRDCDAGEGLARRPREMAHLRSAAFQAACDRAELRLVRPSEVVSEMAGEIGNDAGPSDQIHRPPRSSGEGGIPPGRF